MSFHEVQFPTNISYGSQGGPGFFTNIIELDSGFEERVARRSRARRSYDVSYGVKSYDDLATLLAFFIARKGAASSFRYKDWSDFTTASSGKDAHAFTDQTIGTGDGTTTQFQLLKRYQSGSQTEVRSITKPVADTVLVGVNGTLVTEGVEYTVDTTTGIITFTTAPTSGHSITAGFQFDVPVRFGADTDQALTLNIQSFSSGDMESMTLNEVLDEDQFEEDYEYGGAEEHGNVSADFSISQGQGRSHSYDPQSGSLVIYLPTKSTIKAGGPIFYLHNLSLTNAITIKESVADGGATVATHAADTGLTVDLTRPSETWYLF